MNLRNTLISGLAAIILAGSSSAIAEQKTTTNNNYTIRNHPIQNKQKSNPHLQTNQSTSPNISHKPYQVSTNSNLIYNQKPSNKKPVQNHHNLRQISLAGINFIKNEEHFKDHKYPDGSKWAIGYGHDILPGENFTKITKDEAEELLRKDIIKAEEAIYQNVHVTLNDNQYAAVVSFVYNIGPEKLKISSFLKRLNRGEFDEAAKRIEKWNTANGNKYCEPLAKRRAREKALFLTIY